MIPLPSMRRADGGADHLLDLQPRRLDLCVRAVLRLEQGAPPLHLPLTQPLPVVMCVQGIEYYQKYKNHNAIFLHAVQVRYPRAASLSLPLPLCAVSPSSSLTVACAVNPLCCSSFDGWCVPCKLLSDLVPTFAVLFSVFVLRLLRMAKSSRGRRATERAIERLCRSAGVRARRLWCGRVVLRSKFAFQKSSSTILDFGRSASQSIRISHALSRSAHKAVELLRHVDILTTTRPQQRSGESRKTPLEANARRRTRANLLREAAAVVRVQRDFDAVVHVEPLRVVALLRTRATQQKAESTD